MVDVEVLQGGVGFDLDVWDDSGLRPELVGDVERKLAAVLAANQASALEVFKTIGHY